MPGSQLIREITWNPNTRTEGSAQEDTGMTMKEEEAAPCGGGQWEGDKGQAVGVSWGWDRQNQTPKPKIT